MQNLDLAIFFRLFLLQFNFYLIYQAQLNHVQAARSLCGTSLYAIPEKNTFCILYFTDLYAWHRYGRDGFDYCIVGYEWV